MLLILALPPREANGSKFFFKVDTLIKRGNYAAGGIEVFGNWMVPRILFFQGWDSF